MSETIGTCEICGATDHHLVEELCPRCSPKTITIIAGGRRCGRSYALTRFNNPESQPTDKPFGVSADLTRAPNGDDR